MSLSLTRQRKVDAMAQRFSLAAIRVVMGRASDMKLTQRKVARRAGISESYLSHLVAGRRAASLDVLAALALVVNVDLEQLVRALPPRG